MRKKFNKTQHDTRSTIVHVRFPISFTQKEIFFSHRAISRISTCLARFFSGPEPTSPISHLIFHVMINNINVNMQKKSSSSLNKMMKKHELFFRIFFYHLGWLVKQTNGVWSNEILFTQSHHIIFLKTKKNYSLNIADGFIVYCWDCFYLVCVIFLFHMTYQLITYQVVGAN